MKTEPSDSPPTPEDFAKRAAAARLAGDLAAAERHCRTVAVIWPERAAGYVNTVGVSIALGTERAEIDLETVLCRARTLAGTDERVLRNLALFAAHAEMDDLAADLLRRSLLCTPNDSKVWRAFGHRLSDTSRPQLIAVFLNPTDPELLRFSVLFHAGKGNWETVRNLVRYARKADLSDEPELLEAYGTALMALNRLDEAIASVTRLVAEQQHNPHLWFQLSVLLRRASKLEESRTALTRALILQPAGRGALRARIRLELEAHQPDLALREVARAEAAIGSRDTGLQQNRAAALVALRRGEDARQILRRLLVAAPDDAGMTLNLASAEQYAFEYATAGEWIRRTLVLAPRSIGGLMNGGLLARYAGEYRKSLAYFDALLKIEPNNARATYYRASLELQDGDRQRGISAFLERFRVEEFSASRRLYPEPSLPLPVWDLSPAPDSTVVIWGEQGIGDEIWFAQFLDDIRSRVGSVLLEVTAKLVPLFRRSFPWVDVLPRGDPAIESAAAGADLQLPMGHLIALCEEFPPRAGYLSANQDLTAAFRRRYEVRFPGKRLIGISWRSVKPAAAMTRSFEAPLRDWGAVFDVPDTALVSLQYNADTEDIRTAAQHFGKPLFSDPQVNAADDIAALAAQIQALDAVVSIANSTAALANGVGVPVYVPLRRLQDDFRYPHRGDRSYWLPAARFSWAPPPDRWEKALEELAERMGRDLPAA